MYQALQFSTIMHNNTSLFIRMLYIYIHCSCYSVLSLSLLNYLISSLPFSQLLRKQLVYNALVSSVVGRSHKKLPPVAESESEFIFKLSTQPALHKVTVNVDMQDNDKQLAGELDEQG